MKNPRITPKERNLIKGAVRRVFSRSELRLALIEKSRIQYHDAARPRVTKWSMCKACNKPTPTYLMQVDHVDPIVPIDQTLEDMTWDEVIDRVWCSPHNLNPLCKTCHLIKSKLEAKLRRASKKRRGK